MTVVPLATVQPKRVWKYRPGDRHRDRLTDRVIIAGDGEGITGDDGIHRYTLLAASNSQYVENLNGLSTTDCLEFLLSLPLALVVGFSINYDINMILGDVPKLLLEKLVADGYCVWERYSIKYTPSKQTIIRDRINNRMVHIYDVFGFFQCSFVKALRDWKVGTQEEIDAIAKMKEARGTFSDEDREKVREYCFTECRLLVELMGRLIAATKKAEIPCSQWYGVGALASGLLKKFGVTQYIEPAPLIYSRPILSAYFGGRFEIAASGEVGKTYAYDIKSAYPSVARSLPCLKHADYRLTTEFKEDAKYALWKVSWNVGRDVTWGPFPWRNANGNIYYPTNGSGYYYHSEVLAARRLYPGLIKVESGIILDVQCDHKPFWFIDDVYLERQRLEAAGDYANKVLKLALNAIYGKTAQSIGHQDKEHPERSKRPPYQSYLWAGMITAGCRAQILDAIREAGPGGVISIATDGLLSTVPIKTLTIGKALGNWEFDEWESTILIQPGIYKLSSPGKKAIEHTRGFGLGETNLDRIIADYKAKGIYGQHAYSATRFVGLASALSHRDYSQYWRKWIRCDRTINFYPTQRFIDHTAPTVAKMVPHIPCMLKEVTDSAPYTPKMEWLDSWRQDVDLALDMEQP